MTIATHEIAAADMCNSSVGIGADWTLNSLAPCVAT